MPFALTLPEGHGSRLKTSSRKAGLLWLLIAAFLPLLVIAFNYYEDLGEDFWNSPWDEKLVVETETPYACPAAAPLGMRATDLGGTEAMSVLGPEMEEGEAIQTTSFLLSIESAADFYQVTGSRAASQCVVRLLDKQADVGALLTPTKHLERQYLPVGAMAIALLKVRSSREFSENSRSVDKITSWMGRVLYATEEYFEEYRPANTNELWPAFDQLAYAILMKDERLYGKASLLTSSAIDSISPELRASILTTSGREECSNIMPSIAPAALSLKLQSAHGYVSAPDDLKRLHDVVRTCLDPQLKSKQAPAVAEVSSAQRNAPRQGDVAWLNLYLDVLPVPFSEQMPGPQGILRSLLGGDLPI